MKNLPMNQFSIGTLVETMSSFITKLIILADSKTIANHIDVSVSGHDITNQDEDILVHVEIKDIPLDISGLPYTKGSITFGITFEEVIWKANVPMWFNNSNHIDYTFGGYSKNILLYDTDDNELQWEDSEEFNLFCENDDVYFSRMILGRSILLIHFQRLQPLLDFIWKELNLQLDK